MPELILIEANSVLACQGGEPRAFRNPEEVIIYLQHVVRDGWQMQSCCFGTNALPSGQVQYFHLRATKGPRRAWIDATGETLIEAVVWLRFGIEMQQVTS